MTKVMIVEDETDIRILIDIVMSKEGYETCNAKDGNEFLYKIDKFHPDIVTLDVMMPGPSTKEILTKLKTMKMNPKIILLSAIQLSDHDKKKLMKNIRGNSMTKPSF